MNFDELKKAVTEMIDNITDEELVEEFRNMGFEEPVIEPEPDPLFTYNSGSCLLVVEKYWGDKNDLWFSIDGDYSYEGMAIDREAIKILVEKLTKWLDKN